MRTRSIFVGLGAAVAVVCSIPIRSALACEPRSPVGVSQPQDDATTLLTEAARLESLAANSDANAVAADRTAESFALRARQERVAAQRQIDPERSRSLLRASALDARAAQSRAQAASMRERAASLRVSAAELRERAAKLAGGGGWRRAPQAV
jgi:hypothetical protein